MEEYFFCPRSQTVYFWLFNTAKYTVVHALCKTPAKFGYGHVIFCFAENYCEHSRPQRPRSFWSAPRIATSGQVQHRKSAIHGLPVTLRMLRVKSDKSDWLWSQSIVFTNPFKTGMSLDLARGRDSWCWPKGARPLRTRMHSTVLQYNTIYWSILPQGFFRINLHIIMERSNK